MSVKGKPAIVVAVCAAVALSSALIGCAAQGSTAPSGQEAASAEPTYQELIEMYPNEYNSAMTHKSDEENEDNSHAGFQVLMETPAVRSSGGAIIREVDPDDPEKTDISMSCVACKSSKFNDLFDQYGYDAFVKTNVLDDEAFATLDGQYWDCYGCHAWSDGELTLEANMAYANSEIFPKLSGFFDDLNPEEAVCGQCHNVANARNFAKSEEEAKNCDPYRYGTDLENVYKALVEGGVYGTDEATGIKIVKENHPQIEVFQDSIHQSMGLSCVSCHMIDEVDSEGDMYVSHDASGTVAQKDEAMEYCLTCHSSQSGLETVDDMRAFLKERQDAQAVRQGEVEEKLARLYNEILAAIESGSADGDALEQAKEKYSLAYWFVYEQQGNLNDPVDGAQIAHNPTLLRNLLERADALADEGLGLV